VVIDGHMRGLAGCASGRIAAIACHAVAGPHDALGPLGVDVRQLTWRFMLVAPDRPGRLKSAEAEQCQAGYEAADVATLRSTTVAIRRGGERLNRRSSTCAVGVTVDAVRVRGGREQ
jgi:hypothetical protein